MEKVIIVGAGLAGSEAAWQVATRGVAVELYEMRPRTKTPVHHTGYFSELVCSNSLRAMALENAVGLLKEEMRRLNSLIMLCADDNRVPAGGALAVDRERFAMAVTGKLTEHENIIIHRREVTEIPDQGVVIIATGPLTSEKLSHSISELTGKDYFYFYDAVAPVITAESINENKVFRSSRYDKGEGDYINCPFTKEEYERFWCELVQAETVAGKSFEKEIFFEGCMPVEVLAQRGKDTLLFGPMKPVGLTDPRTGKRPYAVVQLRRDNVEGTLYNLVGFQTRLKWGEQERVFRMIPGLENAEFVRLGVMHRNSYINSPVLLKPTMEYKKIKGLFFAGQLTGVEGYVESAASGLVAGINAARRALGRETVVLPPETAHGALMNYISNALPKNFQPMNVNFGLFPPLEQRVRNKRERKRKLSERALEKLEEWKKKRNWIDV